MAFFSEYLAPQFFGIIIVILNAVYIYVKYVAHKYWSSRGIAEVKSAAPFCFLWTLLRTKKSFGEFFRDLHLEFKKQPVFDIYMLHRPTLVVTVLTKEFPHFEDREMYCNEKLDPLIAHLFRLSGTKWKNLKAKLSPTFISGKMKHMFSKVEETRQELAESVIENARENELFEVKSLMFRYATDVIASVVFGIKCNSLQNPNAEFLKWGRGIFKSRPFRNALAALTPRILKFFNISIVDKDITEFLNGVFKETLEYRMSNNAVRNNFLDLIMHGDDEKETAHISEDASGKITMLEGAAQAFVFWVAGFETSSSTATYCLYELSLNQHLQDKVAEEMNIGMMKFGGITYESANAMPYLHKTLRKYPSLPVLNRICNQDNDLPEIDLRITKGTAIIIPVMGIHSDPELYPKPKKFDPERFSEENITARHQYAHLPFGEGSRNCIGMRFGLLQTKIELISLLSKYRFRPGPKIKIPLEFDTENVLLTVKGGVTLRIENR